MERQLSYKAISVRDPWARAIFNGKDVENRNWHTHYRGPLLIHCGLIPENVPGLARAVADIPQYLGSVIGIVNLIDCIKNSRSRWAQLGSYHLVLRDAFLLSKPVPYRGKLGLFTIYATEMPGNITAELIRWKTTSR